MVALLLLTTSQVVSGQDLAERIETFQQDDAILQRYHPLTYSTARVERLRRFYRESRASLRALPFATLDRHGQVDYVLFRNHLDYRLRTLDLEERRQREIEPLVPFAAEIVRLAEARQRVEAIDAQKAAAALDQLARQVNALPKPTGVKRPVAYRAALATDALRQALEGWQQFYAGYDPAFTWWTAEPYAQLRAALEAYRKRLEDASQDAIIGDPVGREALISDLKYEMIPYSPEELIDIANREFAWCEQELLKASRELGYGGEWRKALEHVKSQYVPPGEQTQLVKKLAWEAIQFVDQRALVSIPPLVRETWRMDMMPAERQKVNPFFLGGEVISVSHPFSTMSHEEKMMSLRGNNIHFARATVFHELIPGHFLQEFHTERYRRYRRLFATPFWLEGWCLHWEMLFWDLDFAQSPENRIGMLFWRMHRCARIIFSLRFHLEQMTPAQCIDFLVERVGHERKNAEAEVRRSFLGTYPPLYQLAYMMGAIQFRGLRRELVGPGKMSDRDFHDAILRLNNIPVEMVRATLTGQALGREFESAWRFAP